MKPIPHAVNLELAGLFKHPLRGPLFSINSGCNRSEPFMFSLRYTYPVSKRSRLYFDAKSPETYALREAERSVRRHPLPHRAGAGGDGSDHQFRGHLALLAGWPADRESLPNWQSRKLRALRDEDRLTPDLVFRDPYVLDFLGLHDSYSERELEAAILREINPSCSNSAMVSPSLPGRSGSGWTMKTFISTCCSIIANWGGLWPWTSSWRNSARSMPDKWNFICAGWRSTSNNHMRSHPSA